jgi:hypothetical protein
VVKGERRGGKSMLIKGDSGEIILREERPGLLVVELPITNTVGALQEEDDTVTY